MKTKWLLAALCVVGLARTAGAAEDAHVVPKVSGPGQVKPQVSEVKEGTYPVQEPAHLSGGVPQGVQLTDPLDYPGRRSAMEMGRQDWDVRSGEAPEGPGSTAYDHNRAHGLTKKWPHG
jgi:hypothetical protein